MSQIIAITDDLAANEPWLAASEGLHRQLRPDLPVGVAYVDFLKRIFSEGGEMAVVVSSGAPKALAVFRRMLTTSRRRRFYVDDLVTDEQSRSRAYGGQLLAWLEARARATGCDYFDLSSGVQRTRAHRFYFRHGLTIVGYSFSKKL